MPKRFVGQRLLTLMALLVFLGLPIMILQADAPRGGYRLMSVSQILSQPEDDSLVTLVGRITEQVGGSTYLFSDGTGKLQLNGEDFKLPINTVVVIAGRVSQPFLGVGQLKVDVLRWKVLNGGNSDHTPR